MECELEFSVNVSCPGLAALMNTPCVGKWTSWTHSKPHFPDYNPQFPNLHPSYKRRIEHIFSCQGYSQIWVWMLEAFKQNVAYYFGQVRSFWIYNPDAPLGTAWTETFNLPWHCFFIGKYPIYWDYRINGPRYAHDFYPGKCFAFGTEPFIAGVDMNTFKYVDPPRWDLYLPKWAIDSYNTQKRWLEDRKTWQMLCVARTYEPEPTRQRKTTQGQDWPGAPWSDVPLPIPQPEDPQMQEPGTPGFYCVTSWTADDRALTCNLLFTSNRIIAMAQEPGP